MTKKVKNRICTILIFSLVSVLVSCAKKKKDGEDGIGDRADLIRHVAIEGGTIRKFPEYSKNQQFVENSNFTASKLPNIYFIFFDTLRPDYALQYGNHIKEFYDKNLSFNQSYGAGTATVYSTFSLFNAMPAFVTYHEHGTSHPNDDYYGSIFLKILKKLGYSVNTYGYYWGCIKKSYDGDWSQFLKMFFGVNSKLIDRCQVDRSYDNVFDVNLDEVTNDELEKKLNTVITTPDKNFSLISFYNNHDTYKWGSLTSGASTDVGDKEDFKQPTQTKNRYINSVKASNLNFKRVMDLIGTLPGHEDAIIVLYSDHGESVYERGRFKHGGLPYQERIRNLLSFQFTEASLHSGNPSESGLASISDIFPTVLDYLNVSPQIAPGTITGKSLLSNQRNSAVVVGAASSLPTRKMVLVNKTHKAWINVEDEDFYSSNTFTYEGVSGFNDEFVPDSEQICMNKSDKDCQYELIKAFPDAMAELYPTLSNEIAANKIAPLKKRILATKPKPKAKLKPTPKAKETKAVKEVKAK